MRKIIMNLAMSLDGYIADEDGAYAWIEGDGSKETDTKQKWSHDTFLEGIDIVVMGRHCYDQKMHEDFKDKTVYVATSKSHADEGNVHFINEDICDFILKKKAEEGKDIYLFGGGVLIDAFLKRDIVDEYIVGIIPILLGNGRPLFLGDTSKIKLHLEEYYFEDSIAIMKYTKR